MCSTMLEEGLNYFPVISMENDIIKLVRNVILA